MSLSDMLIQMFGGTIITIEIFLATLIFSLPLGLLLTFLYASKNKLVSSITGFYILIIRGTPLILQLFFVFFGVPFLPYIGKYLVLDRFSACVFTFIFNYAAYFAEIFRGGIKAVDAAQYEAAKVLGMTKFQTIYKIVLPQMFRVVLPTIGNEAIVLVKDTSLVTVLALPELLHVTKNIVNTTASIMPFAIAGVFYLVMSYIMSVIFQKLEKKYSYEC